jgi:hypothetical protein
MFLRPPRAIPIVLFLAAPAVAQTFESEVASSAVDRDPVLILGAEPPRVGALTGFLELPAVGEGRLDGVLLDEEGLPLFGVQADLPVWVPSGAMSARFVYGGIYGRIAAVSPDAPLAEALVQGEWVRFGALSPNGELLASIYLPTPMGPRSIGTLRASIRIDGGPAASAVGPVPGPVADVQPDPTIPPLPPGPELVASQHLGAHASPNRELRLGGIVDPGPSSAPTIVSVERLGAHAPAQPAPIVVLPLGSAPGLDGDDGSLLGGPNHGTFAGTWILRVER